MLLHAPLNNAAFTRVAVQLRFGGVASPQCDEHSSAVVQRVVQVSHA
jgi:hypothetical protein